MDHLKKVRRKHELTQKQMAEVLKISLSHYKQIENDFKQPSIQLLVTLKKEFPDTDMNILIEEKGSLKGN